MTADPSAADIVAAVRDWERRYPNKGQPWIAAQVCHALRVDLLDVVAAVMTTFDVVAATTARPDCPACGGTGNDPFRPASSPLPCPYCSP